MTDISTADDVHTLVHRFYDKIRADDLLGPVFALRIGTDGWAPHLARMCTFWGTVLFNERGYYGNPFAAHRELPVDAEHFEHWLDLFRVTVDEYFAGPKADEAKWRAERMAEMFQLKLKYYRERPGAEGIL